MCCRSRFGRCDLFGQIVHYSSAFRVVGSHDIPFNPNYHQRKMKLSFANDGWRSIHKNLRSCKTTSWRRRQPLKLELLNKMRISDKSIDNVASQKRRGLWVQWCFGDKSRMGTRQLFVTHKANTKGRLESTSILRTNYFFLAYRSISPSTEKACSHPEKTEITGLFGGRWCRPWPLIDYMNECLDDGRTIHK